MPPSPSSQRPVISAARTETLSAHPLPPEHWQAIVQFMKLSPREAEVAQLKIRGAQVSEIASLLNIKAPTVRTINARILTKAGVRNHEFFAHFLQVSYQIGRECRHNRRRTSVDSS